MSNDYSDVKRTGATEQRAKPVLITSRLDEAPPKAPYFQILVPNHRPNGEDLVIRHESPRVALVARRRSWELTGVKDGKGIERSYHGFPTYDACAAFGMAQHNGAGRVTRRVQVACVILDDCDGVKMAGSKAMLTLRGFASDHAWGLMDKLIPRGMTLPSYAYGVDLEHDLDRPEKVGKEGAQSWIYPVIIRAKNDEASCLLHRKLFDEHAAWAKRLEPWIQEWPETESDRRSRWVL